MVAANGVCVTIVGTDSFDDFEMVESVLLGVESLREPFLKKLKDGILLCCEKRCVDDNDAGWHDDVS